MSAEQDREAVSAVSPQATRPAGAVFLSYASEDAAAAERIAAALRSAGIEVWFDKSELRGGDAWDRQIREQIHDCRLFVPVISANSERRDEGYFRREWALAADRTRDMAHKRAFLVPVVIDGTPERGASVPDKFHELQWTRLPGGETSPEFVERIGRLLSPEAGSARGPAEAAPAGCNTRQAHSGSVPETWRFRPALWGIGVLLALALSYLVLDKLWLSKRTTTIGSSAAATTPPEKSIAVLPFVDLSEKHDQEYFSDGLTEELIDRLAGASGLKVIARTSSFQFKGKNEDVRSIARKLDVANLLEGSVRKYGQSLRVTAQLIRAADGTHLWSHSYDQHVADVFQVQEAIAEKVARALESALTTSSVAAPETPSLQAYEAVQKGRYFWRRSELGDADKAIALFEEATRLDPNYARAWARVAAFYQFAGYSETLPVAEARSKSLTAVQRALAIDPGMPLAHAVLATIYRDFDWKWQAAKEEFETAARLDPNDGYQADAGYLNWMLTGDISGEIAWLRHDLVRDPLDTSTLWTLGISYWAAQRYQESADTYLRLLELNPRYSGVPGLYAHTLVFMGKYDKALATALTDTDRSSQLDVLPCIYWRLGRKAESDAALEELEKDAAKSAYDIARMWACRTETDRVFAWLDRGYREHQSGMQNVKFDPYFLGLHQDPRFQSLLVKMNLDDRRGLH